MQTGLESSPVCVLMTSSHTGQLSRREWADSDATSGASSVSAGCSSTTAGCVGSTDSDPENESVRELCREAWHEEASRMVAASGHLLLCRFGIHTQPPLESSAALSRCSLSTLTAITAGSFTTARSPWSFQSHRLGANTNTVLHKTLYSTVLYITIVPGCG